MKREFKEGEIIFNFDYWNADLNGFGKVIKDTIVESGVIFYDRKSEQEPAEPE